MPTETGAASGSERVEEHHARQRKRGLKLTRVWVPASDVGRIRDQAKAMRAEAGLPLPEDTAPPFPGWAYVCVEKQERELHAKLKEAGARWIRDEAAWRIRADRVAELGLEDRLLPDLPISRIAV